MSESPNALGYKDHCEPLFGRFVGLHPKVGQAQVLFDIKVIHLNGPTPLIDQQDLLCREREIVSFVRNLVASDRIPVAERLRCDLPATC
jgi:hypothetical protein